MPVSALIGDTIEWMPPDSTLLDAARRITKSAIGAVVIGDGEKATGIVSERDLVRAMAERRDPSSTRVIEVATTELAWCDLESTVSEVGAEMMDRYIRHVLVEDAGTLVGIVSGRDLLGVLTAPVEEI
jgi:CBS domain-containing protein